MIAILVSMYLGCLQEGISAYAKTIDLCLFGIAVVVRMQFASVSRQRKCFQKKTYGQFSPAFRVLM